MNSSLKNIYDIICFPVVVTGISLFSVFVFLAQQQLSLFFCCCWFLFCLLFSMQAAEKMSSYEYFISNKEFLNKSQSSKNLTACVQVNVHD